MTYVEQVAVVYPCLSLLCDVLNLARFSEFLMKGSFALIYAWLYCFFLFLYLVCVFDTASSPYIWTFFWARPWLWLEEGFCWNSTTYPFCGGPWNTVTCLMFSRWKVPSVSCSWDGMFRGKYRSRKEGFLMLKKVLNLNDVAKHPVTLPAILFPPTAIMVPSRETILQ